MTRIRAVQVRHFRGIQELVWFPKPGLNCLIGPGDSCKSTILDAVDLCLGARRSIQFSDADFHRLDVDTPITIEVTIGDLDDGLKNLDAYGMYLRGFRAATSEIEDEPEHDAETVLTIRLVVASDLEPTWTWVSDRAEAQGLTRSVSWTDRLRIAPTRIGAMAGFHLSWSRGSVLNRLSEERADASAALVKAAREARTAFGEQARAQLSETLTVVAATAKTLGVPVGEVAKALLDAHSLSFGGGTIALHDQDGVPLRGLGLGSTRLLISGLERKAAAKSTAVLVDELEHGLEPHRIIRLIGSLGAKEILPPLQVFMTTHSPVALRELSGDQLFVTRTLAERHEVRALGTDDNVQSTIRLFPDAFLAPKVIVCEGASEVGLIRGLDQFRVANEHESIAARGTALVDCGGGEPERPFMRANVLIALGYKVAVMRDDDKPPAADIEAAFSAAGGAVFAWRAGRALEDELFASLTEQAVEKLVDRAIELHDEELIDAHIRTASQGASNLQGVRDALQLGVCTDDTRRVLGRASRTKKAGWFKSVTWMEDVARDIVGPDLKGADAGFRTLLAQVFLWTGNAVE